MLVDKTAELFTAENGITALYVYTTSLFLLVQRNPKIHFLEDLFSSKSGP